MPNEVAALWAQSLGADGLILTGGDFDDTLRRVAAARAAGVSKPIYIGGGVDDANVAQALAEADGAIVSTSLRRKSSSRMDVSLWDGDAVRRLVDAAGGA